MTAQLTGTVLPGVTRDTLLALARRLGDDTSEERIAFGQWRAECASGLVT